VLVRIRGGAFFTIRATASRRAAEVSCRIKVSAGPVLLGRVALIAKKKLRRLGFRKIEDRV